MRHVIFGALTGLLLASASLAAEPSQGPPDFGLDTSGPYRNLNLRDATLSGAGSNRVPMGYVDTATHDFIPATVVPTATGATANYHPRLGPEFIRTQGYSVVGTGGALYAKVGSQPAHAFKFSITDAAGATVWYGLAPSEWPNASVDMVGALGNSNGTSGNGANDTAAFTASQSLGVPIRLRPGAIYRLMSRIDVLDGAGFVGSRNATIYADPAGFTHASTSATNRYGTTAVVLLAQGGSSPSYVPMGRATFAGFKLIMGAGNDTTDGRYVTGIAARNVAWVEIHDVEITGGTTGAAVQVMDVSGIVANNYIHDFYDDRDWTPEFPQMLGIWVDGDAFVPAPNTGSENLRITGNVIQRMMTGPAQYAVFHWQPDGIGLADLSTHNVAVDNNDISYVGKAIWQLGGSYNYIHHNRISYAFNQAITCANGCQRTTISDNSIYTAGATGVALGGSNSNRDTAFNVIRDNVVVRVGDTNWSGFGAGRFNANDTSCYMTGVAGYTYKETNDKFIGNYCNPDTTGAGDVTWAAWRAGSSAQVNDWLDNVFLPGTAGTVRNVGGELGLYRDGLIQIPQGTAASANTGTIGHVIPYLDTANIWSANQIFSTAAGGSLLTLDGTNNTSSATRLIISHRRATPTIGDDLGQIHFQGNDSGGTLTTYAYTGSIAQAVADGAESGLLVFATTQGGTALTNRAYIGAGLAVGASTDPGAGGIFFNGKFSPDKTLTPAGTTGAQTINKTAGSVNFAASDASLVVTNSLVSLTSLIICSVQTSDPTMKTASCVPVTGSFTIRGNAPPTGETRVGFLVLN